MYSGLRERLGVDTWVTISDFLVVNQLDCCRSTYHSYKIIFLSCTVVHKSVWKCDRSFFDFVAFRSILDRIHSDDYLVGLFSIPPFLRLCIFIVAV